MFCVETVLLSISPRVEVVGNLKSDDSNSPAKDSFLANAQPYGKKSETATKMRYRRIQRRQQHKAEIYRSLTNHSSYFQTGTYDEAVPSGVSLNGAKKHVSS